MSKDRLPFELLNAHFSAAGKMKASWLIDEWNVLGGRNKTGVREISLVRSKESRLRLASYDVENEHIVIRATVLPAVRDHLVAKYNGQQGEQTASIRLAELQEGDIRFIARCCYKNFLG